jgi:hypothetical protein
LSEGHGAELLSATQYAHAGIAAITRHDSPEAGSRRELYNLREQRLAQAHSSPPEKAISGNYSKRKMRKQISNRRQIFVQKHPPILGVIQVISKLAGHLWSLIDILTAKPERLRRLETEPVQAMLF